MTSTERTRKEHQRIKSNLKLIQTVVGLKTVCTALRISRATWYNYMAEPWATLSYDDYVILGKLAGINAKDIVFNEIKLGANGGGNDG